MAGPTDSQALASTALELESIPKLDKSHFISSFIDSQKRHANLYAEEGRALLALEASSHHPVSRPEQKENQIISAFATPVLVPRATKLSTAKETSHTNPLKDRSPGPISSQSQKAKAKSTQAKSQKNSIQYIDEKSKKRTEKPSDDDDEHAARLAERRDRKRTKREIVRLTDGPVDPKRHSEASETKRKKPRTDGAGLALMHGFVATNVGKNRLTIPPPIIGVFNKGKASTKTQVGKKISKAIKTPAFLESVFLGETSKRGKIITSRSKAESSSNSSSSEESALPTLKNIRLRKKTLHQSPLKDEKRSSTVSSSSSQGSIDNETVSLSVHTRAESKVWDIERDSFVLPSAVSIDRQQSVVVQTQNLSWGKVGIPGDNQEDLNVEREQEGCSQLSSSLAPSQSASQGGLSRPNRVPFSSKYFMPEANTTAKPANMIHSIIQPVPSLETQKLPVEAPSDRIMNPLADPSSPNLQSSLPCLPTNHSLVSTSHYYERTLDHPADEGMDLHRPPPTRHMTPTLDDSVVVSDPIEVDGDERFLSDQPPFAYSDSVVFSDSLDLEVLHVDHPSLLPRITYPDEFYIPASVDAPPLQDEYNAPNISSLFDSDDSRFPPPSNRFPRIAVDYADDQQMRDEYVEDDNIYPDRLIFEPPPDHEGFAGYDDNMQQAHWQDIYSDDGEEDVLSEEDLEEMGGSLMLDESSLVVLSLSDEDVSAVDEDSVLEALPTFLQGRELLLGLGSGADVRDAALTAPYQWPSRVSGAEADVARNLKGHWLPQKL